MAFALYLDELVVVLHFSEWSDDFEHSFNEAQPRVYIGGDHDYCSTSWKYLFYATPTQWQWEVSQPVSHEIVEHRLAAEMLE